MIGINIYSGSYGLGGALTNMTCLAKSKNKINKDYPIEVVGIGMFPDLEEAYQTLKHKDSVTYNDRLMIDLMVIKLNTHTMLKKAIDDLGGVLFLNSCTHYTYARSERFRRWEGRGKNSRFIRNLILAYKKANGIINELETVVVNKNEHPVDICICGDNYTIFFKDINNISISELDNFTNYLSNNRNFLNSHKHKTLGCVCRTKYNVEKRCHGDVIVNMLKELQDE